ncbi:MULTISPECIES: LutC/YkgG family protein [unclassified Lentilitoribacter]|jgi:L-lactate dehydrogenase complex protein LldG|uniref:LutC/YkgG family protein n=1 Tax=unclassified Lentilitoribacter TaxID=2647570 RepID=UPI0013A6EE31|nr:LUD domain-containing protein [Lentilitoribacter sp. Alg239-R112]
MNDIRDSILGSLRTTLAQRASIETRKTMMENRLKNKPSGIIPKRGQLKAEERIELFVKMASDAQTVVTRVAKYTDIPKDVVTYLRAHNLPFSVCSGHDKRLAKAKWASEPNLEVEKRASDGGDLVGISHATSAIAESGTLLLTSGKDNPTTINFLADHHIVILNAKDIKGDLESALGKLKKNADGSTEMPRAINLITGPSRSGDIEQKLLLGAHGPRALKIVIVG